jgi:hypothetical protein
MLTDYRRNFVNAGYNRRVFRLSCTIFATLVFLASCRDELKTKEKVQAAVIERLEAHSGLDLKALDVTTTDVSFDRNKAVATVAFHPKGDPSVNSGMTMKYNLEERDGKWVVTGVNNSQGSSMGAHPPLGQPPIGQPGDGQLPAGHPSLPQPAPSQP